MKADYIRVKEVDFISITECKIEKKVNEHGKAKIVGIIENAMEDICISYAEKQEYLTVVAKEFSGESNVIFVGYIENMEIDCNTVKVLTLELSTGTKQMDLSLRTRTFQNVGMTYQDIIKSNEGLNRDIGAASIFYEDGNKAIGNLIAQYKETDWEFAKRMASRNNTFIRPSFDRNGCKYFWGLNIKNRRIHEKPDSFYNYKIKKRSTEYQKIMKGKSSLAKNIKPEDSFSYYFSSREILEIGDCVNLNSKTLYVYANFAELDGQELINHYELRTATGFKKMTIYNKKLIGASLVGKVLHAERDLIDLKLNVDQPYSDHGKKLFAYSTVYSSPDGTGWYCMPESGDDIRLYFPSEKEEDAYAISSVHLEVSSGRTNNNGYPDPRTDPDYKTFTNPAGKEILFSPTELVITNPAVGSITLSDSEGIIIESTKSIQFKAMNFIEIHSTTEKIIMNAKEDITMEQGENVKFKLHENVYLKGAKLKLQEE